MGHLGGLDLVHTLAYKGMGVFPGYDANLPTQLWVASRYIQALSLLLGYIFLEKRLRDRGTDDEKTISTRLKKAAKEIKKCVSYDYLLFNDKLDQAVEELKSILIAERCRKSVRLAEAQTLFNLGAH